MLSQKTLILVATDYPFGFGEPYLEDEMKQLSRKFNRIILVLTHCDQNNQKQPCFYLPSNVELIYFHDSLSSSEKLFSLKKIFTLDFMKELIQIKKIYHQKLNLGIFKTLLIALYRGDKFADYVEKLILSHGCDPAKMVLYSYWCTSYTYGLVKIKRHYPKIKAITRMHGWDVYFERNEYNFLPLWRCILMGLDRIFPISDHAKYYLLNKLKISSSSALNEKINVSKLGTEPQKKINITGNIPLRIISISFINKIKRINLLIDSLVLINDFSIEWNHVGGEDNLGIEEYAQEKLCSKENISFSFKGTLDKSSILQLIVEKQYNFLINVSSTEGIPFTMMEVMSFGIPVIGTEVGGVPEIVKNNFNGILLSADPTPVEIADAIRKFYEMGAVEYEKFRQNAFNTWEESFNAEKNYTRFVEEILAL